MKKALLLLIVFLFTINLSAQIGGLSALKLGSFSATVVPDKQMEFEPGFGYYQTSYYWDDNSDLQEIYSTSDSTHYVSAMSFRFTIGLWDKLELGVSISPDLAISNWGARYIISQNERMGFAAIGGVNIPLGNRVIDKRLRTNDDIANAGFGGVFSYSFTDKFSTDFAAQYMYYLDETVNNEKGSAYLHLDVGYFILNGNIQLISGLAYARSKNDICCSSVLTLNSGFAVETGKNYSIAFNFPVDIYGKHQTRNTGLSFVLTILLD